MNKDLRQLVTRLQREGLVVGHADGGKHIALRLRGGLTYTAARTPSDHRGLKNMECAIRRLTRG